VNCEVAAPVSGGLEVSHFGRANSYDADAERRLLSRLDDARAGSLEVCNS
jgi:hypothetical protein